MPLIHIRDLDGVFKDVDESELVKSTSVDETDDYRAERVEYRRPGNPTPVHQSAHVTMKRLPPFLPLQGTIH